MTLLERRLRWEEGLKPVLVIDRQKTEGDVLVVLEEPKRGTQKDPTYSCHRYFNIGDDWVCSADAQCAPLLSVWSWLNRPNGNSAFMQELPEPVTEEMVLAEAKA